MHCLTDLSYITILYVDLWTQVEKFNDFLVKPVQSVLHCVGSSRVTKKVKNKPRTIIKVEAPRKKETIRLLRKLSESWNENISLCRLNLTSSGRNFKLAQAAMWPHGGTHVRLTVYPSKGWLVIQRPRVESEDYCKLKSNNAKISRDFAKRSVKKDKTQLELKPWGIFAWYQKRASEFLVCMKRSVAHCKCEQSYQIAHFGSRALSLSEGLMIKLFMKYLNRWRQIITQPNRRAITIFHSTTT